MCGATIENLTFNTEWFERATLFLYSRFMTTFELIVVALLIYIAISIDWKNDEGFLVFLFKGLITGFVLVTILAGFGLLVDV